MRTSNNRCLVGLQRQLLSQLLLVLILTLAPNNFATLARSLQDGLREPEVMAATTEQNAVISSPTNWLDRDDEELRVAQILEARFGHLLAQATTEQPQHRREVSGETGSQSNSTSPMSALKSVICNEDTSMGSSEKNPSSPLDNRRDSMRLPVSKRRFFRLRNKVFSRSPLPEVYSAQAGPTRSSAGIFCGAHIGCMEELVPSMPSILKSSSVNTTIWLYHRKWGMRGHRVPYEPITHYQLAPDDQLEDENSGKPIGVGDQGAGSEQNRRRPSGTPASWQTLGKLVRSQEYPFDLSKLEAFGFEPSELTRVVVGGYFAKDDESWIDQLVRQWLDLEPTGNVIKVSWAHANRGLYPAVAHNSRLVARHLTLLLHYLDQLVEGNGLDRSRVHLVGHSLGAHMVGFVGADFGGQFARITGLDPAGPIFLDLNSSLKLDPNDAQFVDVVHSNGGSLTGAAFALSTPSGHVDYYVNGGSRQPGCPAIAASNLGLVSPVELLACSHRRAYRYLLEVNRLTLAEQRSKRLAGSGPLIPSQEHPPNQSSTPPPTAYLFEADAAELDGRLNQPRLITNVDEAAGRPLAREIDFHRLDHHLVHPRPPRGLYFVRTRPDLPYFGSYQFLLSLRFPASEQPLRRKLTLFARVAGELVAENELDDAMGGQLTIMFAPADGAKYLQLNQEPFRLPEVQLMWRYRSSSAAAINLLLGSQLANELRVDSLDLVQLPEASSALKLLRSTTSSGPLVRYFMIYGSPGSPSNPSGATVTPSSSIPAQQRSSSSTSSGSTLSSPQDQQATRGQASAEIVMTRNQWHRFEGRLVQRVE